MLLESNLNVYQRCTTISQGCKVSPAFWQNSPSTTVRQNGGQQVLSKTAIFDGYLLSEEDIAQLSKEEMTFSRV